MRFNSKLSNKNSVLVLGGTALSLAVCVVAFVAWGQGRSWQFSNLSAYSLFPLFGLLAFSLLWAQYMAIAGMKYFKVKSQDVRSYFRIAGYFVLIVLLLHPSLLIWQLWQDGFGLPPQSYLQNYIAPGFEWAIGLGTLALLFFLGYELHRFFRQNGWWKWVVYASEVAMIFVFFHALALGGTVQDGWFRGVWLFYGVGFLAYLLYVRLWPLLANKPTS